MQVMARYDKIWQNFAKFQKLLPNIAHFLKLCKPIARYDEDTNFVSKCPFMGKLCKVMASYGQIWRI